MVPLESVSWARGGIGLGSSPLSDHDAHSRACFPSVKWRYCEVGDGRQAELPVIRNENAMETPGPDLPGHEALECS